LKLQEVALETAKHWLIPYTLAFRPDYRAAPLHRRIADALKRVESGACQRLMIFVPPRHGKSMLTSEHFPAWYLGRNPSKSIVCATYAQDLADDFGRKVRNQMIDPLFREIFPGCAVSPDSASISRIATQQHGNYYAVGIGGALTGRGAHVLVIDDPHKDRQEADSELMRKRAKDWFQSVAYTRLMPNGAIVVMQTRWHEDDLAGWLLREHADEKWEVIRVPALSESGEAAWPTVFPVEMLEAKRRMSGPREWSALYMQEPIPGGGGEFKREWPKTWRGSEPAGNGYILVDPAGEQRPDNDFTSMWVVRLAEDGNYYWVDGVRDRLNITQRAATVMRLHRKWKPIDVRYERYGMMGDVQALYELQGRENYRFSVTEVSGNKLKKEDRIRRLIPMFEQGKFYAPESLHYTDSQGVPRDLVHTFVEEELLAFPAGIHDDMLDALSRIVEPDLPLIWPQQHEEPPKERYWRDTGRRASAWAA
jgi:predicted phage terminase large subunit-like protein